MFIIIKAILCIRCECRGLGKRTIRRVKIEDCVLTLICAGLLKVSTKYFHSLKKGRISSQCLFITDLWICILSMRYIEGTFRVNPIKTVETCSIEENKQRSCLNLRDIPRIEESSLLKIIVFTSISIKCNILRLDRRELENQVIDIVTDCSISTNKFRIDIIDNSARDIWIFLKNPEKYCTSTHKRFYISNILHIFQV